MTEKTLVMLRGVPYSGKSYRAKELAGDQGVIYSTDEFYYKIVEPDKPHVYSFKPDRIVEAHNWNRQRAYRSIEAGHPLIVIDNTNTTFSEMKPYVSYAVKQGYDVRFEEPTSPWWSQIRPLLDDKKVNEEAIKKWCEFLAEGSKGIHNVPTFAIERMLFRWMSNPTIESVLEAPDL